MKNRTIIQSDDWATPPDYYNDLDAHYGGFDFDPCPWHHDLNKWDALELDDWGGPHAHIYVNPPYSDKKATGRLKTNFVRKGIHEAADKKKLVIFLLPVSTSTFLFHDYIKPFATNIKFERGRIPFIGVNTKGQFVNYHLIQEVDKDATIIFEGKRIPMFVKNSGQHDSMVVEMDYLPKKWFFNEDVNQEKAIKQANIDKIENYSNQTSLVL